MKGLLITILVVAAILAGGWAMGWIKFSDSEKESAIQLNKEEMKEDTEKAGQATKEATEEAVETTKEVTKEAVDSLNGESEDKPEEPKDPVKEDAEPIEQGAS